MLNPEDARLCAEQTTQVSLRPCREVAGEFAYFPLAGPALDFSAAAAGGSGEISAPLFVAPILAEEGLALPVLPPWMTAAGARAALANEQREPELQPPPHENFVELCQVFHQCNPADGADFDAALRALGDLVSVRIEKLKLVRERLARSRYGLVPPLASHEVPLLGHKDFTDHLRRLEQISENTAAAEEGRPEEFAIQVGALEMEPYLEKLVAGQALVRQSQEGAQLEM